MISVIVAAVSALEPNPIRDYYHLRGYESQVFMNGLQFREQAFQVFVHRNHLLNNMQLENISFSHGRDPCGNHHRPLESSIQTLTADMLIRFNVVAAYQR